MKATSLLAGCACALLILSSTSTTMAQPAVEQASASVDKPAVDKFRAQLVSIAQNELQIAEMTGKDSAKDAAQKQLDRAKILTDGEIAVLASSGVNLERLDLQLGALRAILADNAQTQQAKSRNLAPQPKTAGFPDADFSSVCGGTRPDTDAMFAAKVALQVARGVWAALSRACDEVVVVLGEGGNLSLPCIVADEALFAAEAVLEDFDFCDSDIDSATIDGTYARVGHLHGDVESARSGIISNDNTNKTAIINNDNSNRDTLLANSNANRVLIIANNDANTTALINLILASKGEIITNSNANRDMIINEMHTIGCEIIRLLCTPDGQRGSTILPCTGQPAYPYDWPEKPVKPGNGNATQKH